MRCGHPAAAIKALWLRLSISIAFEQAFTFRGDASGRSDGFRHRFAPGISRKRVAGWIALLVNKRRQLLATVESDGPATLSAHVRRRHRRRRFFYAGFELRPVALGELATTRCSQPAFRVFRGPLFRNPDFDVVFLVFLAIR